MDILQNIQNHDDLVALNDEQRMQLCGEIRDFLISNISKTGGHLASNLGVTELSVALETVFDTRIDRLVFDVGHQSYVHKLLTGRKQMFYTLRQMGGIAGFPKPSESDADAFVAGHASSSVSIALGMARARTLQKKDYHVIALLGDGAATGGMAYEGLNDAAASGEPIIVILNDNEMSIDKNVGGVSRHLSYLRTKDKYLGMKERYRQIMSKVPGGAVIYRITKNIKNWFKRVLIPETIFENMGFTYYGPVDGHDLPELIRLLQQCKDIKEPVLLHVVTQKGKGYVPAEKNPSAFHGVGHFDPISGISAAKSGSTFSDTFGQCMLNMAKGNDKLCAITAAMPSGTGLTAFQGAYPKRFFDVGIAEEHAVSMAGGLAKQGMVPVVALYSTFLQRAYDQILQDIAMLKLHVVLAVDRAGLVGDDGETHHGVFDVGFLRQAPGMTVLAPASCSELADMFAWAVNCCEGPVAVRYPRGGDRAYHDSEWNAETGICLHSTGKDVAIVTYGTIVNNAVETAEILAEQGVHTTVLRLTRLTNIDYTSIENALSGIQTVVILEEIMENSGLYQEMSCHLHTHNWIAVNLGREYVPHGKVEQLYKAKGLDARSIANMILEVRSHEN